MTARRVEKVQLAQLTVHLGGVRADTLSWRCEAERMYIVDVDVDVDVEEEV